ncbi:MAG: Fur family transcriptional regulator [Planctomycetaceae bacterium]
MGKSGAPATDTRLDDLRAIVRQAGLKCTPARLAVLGQLAATHGPSSHAEIHEALAGRGFDRATIYRNLSDLQEHRLVSRVDVGDQAARYELTSAHGHGAAHPHFRCDSCGDVLCVEGVKVVLPKPGRSGGKSAPKPAGGHRTARTIPRGIGSVTDIVLRGLCTRCG